MEVALARVGFAKRGGHDEVAGAFDAEIERIAADKMVVGHNRCRGGYARTQEGAAFWLASRFESPAPSGSPKADALACAANMDDGGWNSALTDLIAATPEEQILYQQVMIVPPLPRWRSEPSTSGAFTATIGAISVQPYPSRRLMPNLSLNACATGSRSFSAPTMA